MHYISYAYQAIKKKKKKKYRSLTFAQRIAHDQDRLLIYLPFIQSNCYLSQSLHSVLFKRYFFPFFPSLANNRFSFILNSVSGGEKPGEGNFSRHASEKTRE